jgi:hypothetical protein
MGKLVAIEKQQMKSGRFECTVTKEFYAGEEERAAQVKALKYIKSLEYRKEA